MGDKNNVLAGPFGDDGMSAQQLLLHAAHDVSDDTRIVLITYDNDETAESVGVGWSGNATKVEVSGALTMAQALFLR